MLRISSGVKQACRQGTLFGRCEHPTTYGYNSVTLDSSIISVCKQSSRIESVSKLGRHV